MSKYKIDVMFFDLTNETTTEVGSVTSVTDFVEMVKYYWDHQVYEEPRFVVSPEGFEVQFIEKGNPE